jgi:dTDP-4-dehydrorhamnose 3,5-epimerase
VQFTKSSVGGVLVVDIDRHEDERGFFARTWCRHEFEAQGASGSVVQCSVSHNPVRGTLRGLHYQAAPHGEAKLVRCVSGAIFDVVVDLREDSPTFLQHVALVLSGDNHRALYIPEYCAHGFLTLEDKTEVFYQMSAHYEPSAARGLRWNDPLLSIDWPEPVRVISERDRTYADFTPGRKGRLH